MLIVTVNVLKLAKEDALVLVPALPNIFDKTHRHQNPGCLHFCGLGNCPSAELFAFYFRLKAKLYRRSNSAFPPSKDNVCC